MERELPLLIQGGMGVAVSDWRLARAVSEAGHLGLVSGVALDSVMVRRLQLGDPDGHIRRALDAYPVPGGAERILDRYFVSGGIQPDERFKRTSMKRDLPSRLTEETIMAASFVEVFLAKEGHDGPVGVNFLEKVQAPILSGIYGAMLADVDYVVMGAGIPKTIPSVLDKLAAGLPVDYRLEVKGATKDDDFRALFDPAEAMGDNLSTLKRPTFLAIVSSHVLAIMLATKVDVPVDGFIIEGPTAGGHNAPPRGKLQLNEAGEPIYGNRDVPDLAVFRELGLPFWLAGSYGSPQRVQEALDQGAAGVQVGTAFAFCEESGFTAEIKREVLELARQSRARVFTDPLASPSGFPFKVIELPDTLTEPAVYESRTRSCDLGYLRTAYRRGDDSFGWRCPAEPVDDYVRKGGAIEDTVGRKCLCSALLSNAGLVQNQRNGAPEPTLVTSGDEVSDITRFVPPGGDSYKAIDVIRYLIPDA